MVNRRYSTAIKVFKFRFPEDIQFLKDNGMGISMDRKRSWMNNICIERPLAYHQWYYTVLN